jgi:two-component system, OmpR family, sensor histidine kinase KdpD
VQTRSSSDLARLGIGLAAVAAVTWLFAAWLHTANTTTISFALLMVVLLVAATSRLWVAVTTSLAAMLAFNVAFLPPVGTFTISDPHNWVALAAFLAVSLVASHLSALARTRAAEAEASRDELARLFDLSRDVLVTTEGRAALAGLARAVSRRFDLESVAIALPDGERWDIHRAGAPLTLDTRELASAFAAAQTTLEFDAYARTYAGQRTMTVDGRAVRLVPLRVGTRPIGLLAAAGRAVEAGTLDAVAGVVAIGIERARLLDDSKAAELTRQSEQLKTTLLASIGHDLRTPLTAIRVAAANVQEPEVSAADRREQGQLIEAEVERLNRLFQNLLEMARLDAGAVAAEPRATHPSEIIAAARGQVDYTLRHHRLSVTADPDVPVRLDPLLTASAVAHLLENAAQYAPAGTAIDVHAATADDGLTITVSDEGPGIRPADLPHLFERFYRGAASSARPSGTGMGLWIARGLLAAQHGRVWAENAAGGGAVFTVVVPPAAAGAGR